MSLGHRYVIDGLENIDSKGGDRDIANNLWWLILWGCVYILSIFCGVPRGTITFKFKTMQRYWKDDCSRAEYLGTRKRFM